MTLLDTAHGCRVAIIGDIGGQLDALRQELCRLGVPDNGEGRIPPDLKIIQVGDLVHRGPDSAGVVALVDRHLRATPWRWIQLVGNHEALYLRRRQFSWPERLPTASVSLLREWWSSGLMRAATAVRAGDEWFLVTHAGVTRDFWAQVVGSPPSATATADAVNRLARTDAAALFRTGALLGDNPPDPLVGPLWAVADAELTASWLGHQLPFSQVHGHTSLYDWDTDRWQLEVEIRRLVTREEAAKHVTVTLPGGRLIGVDPGQRALGNRAWRALELTGLPA